VKLVKHLLHKAFGEKPLLFKKNKT